MARHTPNARASGSARALRLADSGDEQGESANAIGDAGAAKKRVYWSNADDLALASALHDYVQEKEGQMPPMSNTGANAKADGAWEVVAAALQKFDAMADKAEAGKKCSAHWSKLRKQTKVSRHTDE